jgi:glycosyltransferase involved in cell wall biosynthesis
LNHVGLIAGAERSLLAHVEALDRARFEPCAICPPGPLTDLLRQQGVQAHNFPLRRFHRTRNPFRLMLCATQVLAVARQIAREWPGPPPDLVHSNSTTAHLYGAQVARRWGVPCVWHVRDLVPLGVIGWWLARRSDAIIATSQAVARCVGAGAAGKVRVIPNGIALDSCAVSRPADQVRAEFCVGASPLVAAVGQIVPWKRHDVFLRAFAAVVERRPDAVAVIVGDDLFGDNMQYKTRIRELVRGLGLEERVRFLGWRDDVQTILNACDLLAVPSQAEPFGRVALEAMIAGKPVVGTRAGGLPDVVAEDETGLLVPPGDPAALGAAMLRVLSEPALAKRMGEAGRERAHKLFDARTATRSVEQLYLTLLRANRE